MKIMLQGKEKWFKGKILGNLIQVKVNFNNSNKKQN